MLKKKESEQIVNLLEVVKDISGDVESIVIPTRRLVRECSVKLTKKMNKVAGRLYLFNDAMMYTKKTKRKQDLVGITLLKDIISVSQKSDCSIEILCKNPSGRETLLFFFDTKEEERSFQSDVHKLLQKQFPDSLLEVSASFQEIKVKNNQ